MPYDGTVYACPSPNTGASTGPTYANCYRHAESYPDPECDTSGDTATSPYAGTAPIVRPLHLTNR